MSKVDKTIEAYDKLGEVATSEATTRIIQHSKDLLRQGNYAEVFPMLLHLYSIESKARQEVLELEHDVHLLYEQATDQKDDDIVITADGELLSVEALDFFLTRLSSGVSFDACLQKTLEYAEVPFGAYVVMNYFGTHHGFYYEPLKQVFDC